jgi:hypothetical protein
VSHGSKILPTKLRPRSKTFIKKESSQVIVCDLSALSLVWVTVIIFLVLLSLSQRVVTIPAILWTLGGVRSDKP